MDHNFEMDLLLRTVITLLWTGDIIVQGASFQSDVDFVEGILGKQVSCMTGREYQNMIVCDETLSNSHAIERKNFAIRLCWGAHRDELMGVLKSANGLGRLQSHALYLPL